MPCFNTADNELLLYNLLQKNNVQTSRIACNFREIDLKNFENIKPWKYQLIRKIEGNNLTKDFLFLIRLNC